MAMAIAKEINITIDIPCNSPWGTFTLNRYPHYVLEWLH